MNNDNTKNITLHIFNNLQILLYIQCIKDVRTKRQKLTKKACVEQERVIKLTGSKLRQKIIVHN